MLISHKNRFIFIHIYKTAGTSVMDVFLPYCRLVDRMAYEFRVSRKLFGMIGHSMGWDDDGMKQFTGYHQHATANEIRMKMGSDIFDPYFKFTFVRNPFDFLVSLYFYIAQSKNHRFHKQVVDMGFSEFLNWYTMRRPQRQLDFVVEPQSNHLLVNYIGRFETLEKDVAVIQEKLVIKSKSNITHRNPSRNRKGRDYREYYDEKDRSLVENYFHMDLTQFGYDFNGFREEIPIMKSANPMQIKS